MQRISITNPQNVIDGTAKKYYFKLRNTGGPKGDKGDKGDTGATGPQGPQGNAATVSVGSTTTLPVGYDATVTNTGSIYNAVLNFGIPRGPQGPQGAKGDKGDTGAKGETGPRGPQGERGTNATVYVGTTSTLAPGSQATVYNSGSDSNAVLNFGIPQGAKGDTGSQGPQGPAGQNFAPTVVAELPATGDESKLYLTPKAHTSQTATGNPIEATVTDGAGTLESFQLDGDTFQQTYTGKNLLKVEGKWSITAGAGVTVTDGADGSLILNGTVTTREDIRLYSSSDRFTLESGKTVTISREPSSSWNFIWHRFTSGSGTVTSDVKYFDPGASSFTYTTLDTDYGYQFVMRLPVGTTFNNTHVYLQLEESASPTSYEPYVGGVPSPNPSYPQQVQTVTGEQTVEIVGKNKYPFSDVTWSTTATSTGWRFQDGAANAYGADLINKTNYKLTLPAGSYTITVYNIDSNVISIQACANGTDSEVIITDPYNLSSTNPSSTITLAEPTTFCVRYRVTNPSLGIGNTKIQIEKAESATSFAPYSKQTLPLDLGSIELCKLGTYQDYIYKDGDSWKVHRENEKVTFNGTEAGWNATGTSQTTPYFIDLEKMAFGNYCDGISTHFKNRKAYPSNNGEFAIRTDGGSISFNKSGLASKGEWLSWLGGNNVTVYYPLAVGLVTDIAITNQNLIAQLEAVRTASLQASNTITNTATAPNLAGDMEIGYYGYNPTNRYDKWLWLDLNNNYEQIGE